MGATARLSSTNGRAAGAIATPHHAATASGLEVLAAGGNAMDAAIAANAMLCVVYPHMAGVGGDLFLLHHHARSGTVHCLNGTGPAPAAATRDAFAERGLTEVPARGPLSVTVPGTVRAWQAALERFGSRSLGELLAPAMAAAEDGVEVTARLAGWIAGARGDLAADPALGEALLGPGGTTPAAGATLRQPALARTLRRLAAAGAGDLYTGELAAEVDRSMRAAGGLLRADDLRAYQPEWVRPLRLRLGALKILTTPPNSQGIAALLMLKAMAGAAEPGTVAHLRALVAAKRAAFGARDRHVTDPGHMLVGADDLLAGALPAAQPAIPPAGGDTVYLCTADAEGNVCSLIQSLYYGFGSCHVAGDTGIVLHNRAHYFSLDPTSANVLAPGKRTLHTLMACLAVEGGRPRYVFGTMGADGQPQTNVQVLQRLLAGASAAEAVGAPRVLHGRFLLEDDPETLHVEADHDPSVIDALRDEPGAVNVVEAHSERMGHAQALVLDDDRVTDAAADPRSDGSAAIV